MTFLTNRTQDRKSISPSSWAVVVALTLASGIATLAFFTVTVPIQAPVAIAIGVTCFAIVAIGSVVRGATRRALPKRELEAFARLFPDRSATLTDADGTVVNGPDAGQAVGDCFVDVFPDAPRAAYQILLRIEAGERDAHVLEFGASGAPYILSAQRIGTLGLVMWTLRETFDLRPDDAMRYQDAPVGFIGLAGDGTVCATNALAEDWGARAGDPPEFLGGSALRDGSTHMLAEARVRAVEMPSRAGEAYLLVPLRHAEISLQEPDEVMELLPVALVWLDGSGAITSANSKARALLHDGLPRGRKLSAVAEGLGRPIADRIAGMISGPASPAPEIARVDSPDGESYVQIDLRRVEENGVASLLATLSDATELKTLEAQFVQSQKMQAVGQLAGGVAHDFNNLLTAISGHADLLLMRHDPGSRDHADLMQIRQNGNRAAGLVRQLLAFSRKQQLRPTRLALSEVLSDLTHLLDRLIGASIQLDIGLREPVPAVRLDQRQFEQVVMNLVVNARDAMPEGGEISVIAESVDLDEPLTTGGVTLPPGRYARISVSDTGAGIKPRDLEKIFEPFFTTKGPGQGTGLGLSTVYGIVGHASGGIEVQSRVGAGTCFRIYLPAVASAVVANTTAPLATTQGTDVTGRETVLVVEDEAPVRNFARRALEMRGYDVHEADCGEAALALLEEDRSIRPELVISDVMMPGLDGPGWLAAAGDRLAGSSVIFMSGYSDDALNGASVPERACFLSKPFSLDELLRVTRDAISAQQPEDVS